LLNINTTHRANVEKCKRGDKYERCINVLLFVMYAFACQRLTLKFTLQIYKNAYASVALGCTRRSHLKTCSRHDQQQNIIARKRRVTVALIHNNIKHEHE